MTVTTAAPTVDTTAMVVIHRFFRRELRLAPGVVQRVDAGDTARVRVVADHLDLLVQSLHHHHTVEDEHLWPVLLERVPDELAPLVHLMEQQHAVVDAALEEVAGLLPQWRADADADTRERIATVLTALHAALVEHLDAEEQQLLPVVARTLTQEQWDALGEAGKKGTPASRLPLVMGMFLYEGDAAVMLAGAPLPVRLLVPPLARRAFRRHALAVHGTATP